MARVVHLVQAGVSIEDHLFHIEDLLLTGEKLLIDLSLFYLVRVDLHSVKDKLLVLGQVIHAQNMFSVANATNFALTSALQELPRFLETFVSTVGTQVTTAKMTTLFPLEFRLHLDTLGTELSFVRAFASRGHLCVLCRFDPLRETEDRIVEQIQTCLVLRVSQ